MCSIILIIAFFGVPVCAASQAPSFFENGFAVEDAIHIKDYNNSHIVLLPVGEEKTLICNRASIMKRLSRRDHRKEGAQVDWYFGNVDPLMLLQFDNNGQSVSHRILSTNGTVGSAFRILDKAFNNESIILKVIAGVDANRGNGDVLGSFSPTVMYALNGVLACVHRRPNQSSSESTVLNVSAVFHIFTLLPPLSNGSKASSMESQQCPPGYSLSSYAGQPVCQACLPGEFSPGFGSPCRPCLEPQDFQGPMGTSMFGGFASDECSKQRVRRAADSSGGILTHRQLPLADFRSVIMHHFLLVLTLSGVVGALIVVGALSFETVWHGVLSGIEVSIAGALDDRFVLDEPTAEEEDA